MSAGDEHNCLKMDSGGNEHCVLCFRELPFIKDIPINRRGKYSEYYVEGAGQLCPECSRKTYKGD